MREFLQEARHRVVDAPDGRVGFRMFLDHLDAFLLGHEQIHKDEIRSMIQEHAEAHPSIRGVD
ncbi:MAG TPA: hypothetical protein VHH32_07870, partial [Gemmatimonadales bacterium]|nr:hypothetical protein [Gemmatimonadales bacterium]